MHAMRLRALLSQICLVTMLLLVAGLPSAAWAHEGHVHVGEQRAKAHFAASNIIAQAIVSRSNSTNLTADRTSPARDATCNGACCGFGCCGACTMVLAEDVSQVAPVVIAGARIPPPGSLGGPGLVPEALPKPPKSFA